MTDVKEMVRSIPLWLKVLTPLVALVAGAMTFGSEWVGLPAQVHENTDTIQAHTDYLRDDVVRWRSTEARYDRIICLLTLPDGVTPIQAEQECPGG